MANASLLFVLGTRSEAIKAIPVLRALAARHPGLDFKVGASGQHAMMFDQIADIEGISVEWNLEAMRARQHLTKLLGRMIRDMEPPIRHEAPKWIVGIGDSATTLAAALNAHAAQIPFIHLEAGLRGAKPGRPYPENVFRAMISDVAALHICPTELARQNLLAEGVASEAAEALGDPGRDALLEKLAGDSALDDPELRDFDFGGPLAVATIVRRENHSDGIYAICGALRRLALDQPEWRFVVPYHFNPLLMEPMRHSLKNLPNVRVTLPLPHRVFIGVLRRADLVLTDSGGTQEEASALGIPIVSLRAALDTGRLMGEAPVVEAGNDEAAIVAEAQRWMRTISPCAPQRRQVDPCSGGAAERIADRLARAAKEPRSCA